MFYSILFEGYLSTGLSLVTMKKDILFWLKYKIFVLLSFRNKINETIHIKSLA